MGAVLQKTSRKYVEGRRLIKASRDGVEERRQGKTYDDSPRRLSLTTFLDDFRSDSGNGIRTRVGALRGLRPSPRDDTAARAVNIATPRRGAQPGAPLTPARVRLPFTPPCPHA